MSAAFEAVWETKMKYNTMRTAAFILAIERIVSAMKGHVGGCNLVTKYKKHESRIHN